VQGAFIAELLVVERTTSVLHKDRWYRPLCNAQFCVTDSLSWKRRVKILKMVYVDSKKDEDVSDRRKVRDCAVSCCVCRGDLKLTFRSSISSGWESLLPGAEMHKSWAPNRLNFVRWHLIFVGPQCGTYCMSAFLAPRILKWLLEFCKILVTPFTPVWCVTPPFFAPKLSISSINDIPSAGGGGVRRRSQQISPKRR
jgi:hypothetical protein